MKEERIDKKGKKGFSILIRMAVMSAVPMMVQTAVLMLYFMGSLQRGMQEEALEGLAHICRSVSAAYDAVDSGDYHMEGELLYKGSYCITENQDTVDSFTRGSDADVTIFYGSTRRATSLTDAATGERIVGTGASHAVSDTVLREGKDYHTTKIRINGENYYAYYKPLKNADGQIAGMVFAGQPSAGVDVAIRRKVWGVFLIGICILATALAFCSFAVKKMAECIVHTGNMLCEISGGSLRVQLSEKQEKINRRAGERRDEIGRMVSSLYELTEKLAAVIQSIQITSDGVTQAGDLLESMVMKIGTSSEEISRAVEDIAKGAVLQAEEIESATGQIAGIGVITEAIAGSVKELKEASRAMKKADEESEQIIYELGISNDKTMESIKKIDASIHKTEESVEKIREAAGLITAIASETSLIALNASIEAAKAGETGKGFAVVASRISKLAEDSAASAGTIGDVIKKLSKDSETSIQIMGEVKDNILNQQGKLKKTKETYTEVSRGIEASTAEAEKMDQQAEECSRAKEKVMERIGNLSAISEENAAAAEETSASMQELDAAVRLLSDTALTLKDQAGELEKGISFFHI